MAGSLYVGYRGAFAEHLQDGIAGDQMDQDEDQRNHQPNYRQRVQHARER